MKQEDDGAGLKRKTKAGLKRTAEEKMSTQQIEDHSFEKEKSREVENRCLIKRG
jgi:hypothetical protein